MPHPCVVCGRSRMNPNNREEEYVFFGFPVNYDDRCRKWLEFCCREDLYKLTKKQLLQRMVCSKHFDRSDFLNDFYDRLNCTAVPSVYDPKQSLYNITCALCGKFRKNPPYPDYEGTTFHHFPGEEFRCLKWLDFVGIDSYYRLTRKEILFCYICSHHFDKSQFVPGYRNRLVDNAVPNIRNPDELTDDQKFTIEMEMAEKSYSFGDRQKIWDPLPPEVLESQACAACGRSRSDPRNRLEKYKFHPFPAYEIGRCLRWCQFLGREDLLKMSPNQIRKLVLCSKHFLAGQNFQRVGPCDAVPTIKEIVDEPIEIRLPERISSLAVPPTTPEFVEVEPPPEDEEISLKCPKSEKRVAAIVSSKKPVVMNKPMPLAKKRGKQKRPTSINIPKPAPINDIRILRKLPLPPASNNWNLQIANQFQPITITNNVSPITNAISADGKKVILPFTGNISNLGQPIPVSSLSCMPPGLLIKINLPQQEKKVKKRGRPYRKAKEANCSEQSVEMNAEEKLKLERRSGSIGGEDQLSENIDTSQDLEDSQNIIENPPYTDDFAELLKFPDKIEVHKHEMMEDDAVIEELSEEHEDIEALDEDIEDSMESYTLEPIEYSEEIQDERHLCTEVSSEEIVESNFIEEETHEKVNVKRKNRKIKRRMSDRSRRTLIPIRSEVGSFLKKLKPFMHRLPKKARAQLKLSIVTMVIDHL